jgi:hypothetical protein
MEWIDLAHDRDQWRALVNLAVNFRVGRKAGKLLGSCETVEKGSAPSFVYALNKVCTFSHVFWCAGHYHADGTEDKIATEQVYVTFLSECERCVTFYVHT